MNTKRLGRKIREKRKQCGLTSQQLAELYPTIGKREKGSQYAIVIEPV